jgi:hypothetical protein
MTEQQLNNLDCKDIKAILSGLVDDEVDAATRHAAERHLGSCQPCRDLLTQAERLNEMIALDAQRHLWPVGLPAGFEDKVLSRTVYGDAYQFAGRQWTSWLGWVAAAACLMLSLSIWFLDRQRNAAIPSSYAEVTQPRATMANADLLRSWTTDGAMPERFVNRNSGVAMSDFNVDRLIDDELALVQPAGLRLAPDSRTADLSMDDAQTLYAASNLLAMLGQADLSSFADIERIRRIAEYDDLLNRLADVRGRVSAVERPMVLAAESILLRIVNGPVDLSDARMMNDTVAALDLATQMESISGQWQIAPSL